MTQESVKALQKELVSMDPLCSSRTGSMTKDHLVNSMQLSPSADHSVSIISKVEYFFYFRYYSQRLEILNLRFPSLLDPHF